MSMVTQRNTMNCISIDTLQKVFFSVSKEKKNYKKVAIIGLLRKGGGLMGIYRVLLYKVGNGRPHCSGSVAGIFIVSQAEHF